MRVGIIAFSHESNTFIPEKTSLQKFQTHLYLRGQEIIDQYAAGNHEVSGFIQGLREEGIEPVPLVFFWASPSGAVEREALEAIWNEMRTALAGCGPLDGLLTAPHGAGVSEVHRDMDGWWLTQVRELLGSKIPIISTLDPHVNLSKAMVDAVDALLPYQTNPHLDQKPRGLKAARLMARTLRGEIRPVVRYCAPPMAINIEKQYTEGEPILSFKKRCLELEQTPGILDATIVLGFPYADVAEMGSGVAVVADGDAALAGRAAREIGWALWESRESFRPLLINPPEAVRLALEAPKPVCLLDMGDNVGGGSVGDGTWLAQLLYNEPKTRTFMSLLDPEAVQAAKAAGVGATVRLEIGGRSDEKLQGGPLAFEGTVVSFPPETYEEPKPRHGGRRHHNTGPAVLLRRENFFLLVTARKLSSSSSRYFDNCGETPATFDVIVAKGVNAPLGAFQEICPTIIRCNTPGTTSADLSYFDYEHRARPLHPWEEPCVPGPEALTVY